ncbi:MAG: hypothetical protein GXW85_02795 [Clostridia bacterium]|nr:hypothetical protein [Clostridia bacterium]
MAKKKININDIDPNPLSLNVEYAQELSKEIKEKQAGKEPKHQDKGQKN